jgi:hypothetical protein
LKIQVRNRRYFTAGGQQEPARLDKDFSFALRKNSNGRCIEVDGSVSLYLEGELYYYLEEGKGVRLLSDPVESTVASLLGSFGLEGLLGRLEGCFTGALIDKKEGSVTLFCDRYGRVPLFYSDLPGGYVFSTSIGDILPHTGDTHPDQFGLICLFSLGYTPAKHTIYDGIFKLGPAQRAIYKKGSLEITSRIVPSRIECYGRSKIRTYAEIMKSSIIARSSRSENWVQLSGGLDTSIILDVLLSEYDKSRVFTVVAKLIDKRGECTNLHDVDRAVRVARHYGVELEVVESVISAERAVCYLERDAEMLREESFFHPGGPLYFPLADFLKERSNNGGVVFSGEGSDSLQNFGFTKADRYRSRVLNEMENKLMSHQFSPSFFRQMLNNRIRSRLLLLFCRHYFGASHFDPPTHDTVTEYLFSFVFSDIRAAFSNAPLLRDICSAAGLTAFKGWLYEHYFGDIIRRIDCEHFYFWLTYVYTQFHLQGRNNQIVYSAFRRKGIAARLPYLDFLVGDFLSRMPQGWGRKITLRTTKYPSTMLARRHASVPLRIVKDLDYRAFRDCNAFRDMMKENVYLAERLREDFRSNGTDALLQSDYFDIGRAQRIVGRYMKNPQDVQNSHLYFLYGIACLKRAFPE